MINKHISDLRRSAGLTDSGSYYRYDYIVDQNQMISAFLNSRNNLGYPLRLQARYKDDRFIYTGDALEKDIAVAVAEAMKRGEAQLREAIIQDVIPDLESTLNSITVVNNQFQIPTQKMRSSSSKFAERFGKLLGKELVKTIFSFFQDNRKQRRKR